VNKDELSSKLDRVYGATDHNDLQQAYDQWSHTYDADVSRLGYLLRAVSTGYIGRFITPDSKVLDAGAGTGLIGSYLAAMGFQHLIAIDLSERMLERARSRGCYRELRQMVLGDSLDFETNSFDDAYAVGVFTEGHAPPDAFRELVRLVRPGGHFIFSIRDDVYQQKGYREVQETLEQEGKWRRVASSPVFQPYQTAKPEVRSRVFVYRITHG
jgi:SAM-dependent methyltransferase